MKSTIENSDSRIFRGISTQSIRNLLPRSISNTQQKANKSNFSKENTPPVDPNLQIDSLPPDLKKPLTKANNSSKESGLPVVASDPSVKVVVRIRPGNWRGRGLDRTVRKVSPNSLAVGDRSFAFDSVVDSSSTQEDVFQLVGVPLVKNSLAGYNTSILSCGQTGSGKTYTMWGPPSAMVEGHSPTSNQGIVPRIFQMLFSEIQEQESSEDKHINYQCRCSFLEIYNEQIGDLLDPTQRNLQIKDDAKNGFYVENLSEEYITSYDDVTQILIKGLSNRKVGATTINSKSSRSHIVFTCVVESWCKGTSSKCFSSSKTSRITLVDIAGTERNKLDDDAGRQCIKEGKNVKKSLSHLGHLVHILAEGARPETSKETPYNVSCLTHLLKESLGGNAKLTVICAISPDEKCKGETLSTLRFGLKAKCITNEPVENEITEDDVNDLSDRIRQLKEELIKEKSTGYNSLSCNSGYFKGRNARESLNQLRVSLSRSMILPRMDKNPEEEVNVDEKDVKELCEQLDCLRSSGEETFQDACEEAECFEDSCEENSESSFPTTNTISENQHERNHLQSIDTAASCNKSTVLNTAPRSSLSLPSRLPSLLQEPTLSESPKIENIQRKSMPTLSESLSASQNISPGVSNCSPEVQKQSTRRSDHIRASLRSSKMFSSPTESLAASLHRGLQIIDCHQRASESSKSSVALSFEHLALRSSQAVNQSSESVPVVTYGRTRLDGSTSSFICVTCNQVFNGSNKLKDSLKMGIVPYDASKSIGQKGEEGLDEVRKREELEKVCAEQAAKIEQLSLLVEQYKNDKEHTSFKTEAIAGGDLEKEKHVLLEEENAEGIKVLAPTTKNDLTDLHEEKESLLKEIETLRNKLQSYVDISWIEESQSQSQSQSLPLNKSLDSEKQTWIQKESEWICLTDELRIDLASNRLHTEELEAELRLEKQVTEELDDALNRSVLGHARIIEHYADLQDKYNELNERYKKIMEGIAQVKKAAAKAGKKGKGARFEKCLAAELSSLRVEREMEREKLRKENNSLRVQLRDTAEAVHAAGELLVRLREAEEALSVAEENYASSKREIEKVKKQMEKQKRKHGMEMVTMKQYLAESRLPESALKPLYWQEEDHNKEENALPTSTLIDDDWRSEFRTAYQEHY